MSVYSIKDLEHLSGIKAHTIRIWEQRYKLFSPQRSETNIRFYTEHDLKKILNISLLYNHGFKISKIAAMPHDQILEEVQKLHESTTSLHDQVNTMTIAMIDLDEQTFSEILDQHTENFGFEAVMKDLVYPFMSKIGILWITDSINPAQEHFITHLVRQKLMVATDRCMATDSTSPLFLLFLPEGEWHELGILFANYILRSRGIKTIYFGQSVPLNALEEVYYSLNPKYIMVSATTIPDPAEIQGYVDALARKFSDSTILITGAQVVGNDIACAPNTQILNQYDDLIQIVDSINKTVSQDQL